MPTSLNEIYFYFVVAVLNSNYYKMVQACNEEAAVNLIGNNGFASRLKGHFIYCLTGFLVATRLLVKQSNITDLIINHTSSMIGYTCFYDIIIT